MSAIPALRMERQEDQKFKVILSYIVSSRPSWATGDPHLKKKSVQKMLSGQDTSKAKRGEWFIRGTTVGTFTG